MIDVPALIVRPVACQQFPEFARSSQRLEPIVIVPCSTPLAPFTNMELMLTPKPFESNVPDCAFSSGPVFVCTRRLSRILWVPTSLSTVRQTPKVTPFDVIVLPLVRPRSVQVPNSEPGAGNVMPAASLMLP